MLGFCSHEGLFRLSISPHWGADGTFRTAPKHFEQAYIIHGYDSISTKPGFFATLKNKEKKTYFSMLTNLQHYASSYGIQLSPATI
ncbi:unnamed protein product [Didymodactylos carnosus]|uniref:Uncharacterized protein n=1 Tax=Didymodactylos carnosus TaxID=1234261 RepID=A0A815U0H2_9BILA|nr:unnamed protein product [Didymodactylos carnosus]CAF4374393.1 unnamed protein product [Didymodactylos carnosus]